MNIRFEKSHIVSRRGAAAFAPAAGLSNPVNAGLSGETGGLDFHVFLRDKTEFQHGLDLYHDDWDIDKFMQYCQVSKSQLFRLFQITFNQSPLKWLKNYRLAQARRLLMATDESIARIAGQVGYNDPLHFFRDFHRAVGVAPAVFRRREKFHKE